MPKRFDMDNSDSSYLAGYLTGISDEVSTPRYLGSAVDYVYETLKDRFEISLDQVARLSPDSYHHVYEWGDSWDARHDNVGNPAMRLWKLVSAGQGSNRTVGFTFLPSIRPSPIHPKEEQAGVQSGKHIFTWKAPVMEYGQTVTISPEEALKGKLVFYWEKVGKVIATSKTIHTTVDPNVIGKFSTFFVNWWSNNAQVIFASDIRPELERNVVPRGPGGRFLKGRSKSASRMLRSGGGTSGARQHIGIDVSSQSQGHADAIKAMRAIAAGYKQGRGGYDNYGH